MKYVLLFVFFVGAFSSFLPKTNLGAVAFPSQQNLIDFVIGNLIAVKVTDTVPYGFNCVNTITTFQNDIQTALALIRNGSVSEGIQLLENSLNATLTSCGAAASEGSATFEAFLEKIKDPQFIDLALGRIKDNFFTILQSYQKGVTDLNNQSYFNAGMDFGGIIHLILSGPDTTLNFINLLIEEIDRLGSVNWPFKNCAASSPLQPSTVSLDSNPSKGAPEAITIQGTASNGVSLKQVQIVTSLNGTPLNTQYDPNTNNYQAGDSFNYKFSITIPSCAPSVISFFFFGFI